MTSEQRACPSAAEIDRLAEEGSASDEILAHIARCRSCAENLAAAKFGQRFGAVLAGHEGDVRRNTSAMPEIFGYQLERELARGGQGVVYLATQLMTGQHVAVKVLPQATTSGHARARLLREIEIIATLHHPRIVRLLDSVTLADGREALIMEYIEGEPMDRWRLSHPEASRREVLLILSQVAEALHHAHQRGVIHRDLKPSNVVIDAEGLPCLLDFGIAARIGPDVLETRVTLTGEFTGTLTYAAPEQVRASGSAPDVRTDIYAMGVIAYEMLTGSPPYATTGSLESVVRSILETSIPARSLAGLSADEWAVVAKALAKDPSRRYQSAAELAGDLRRAASGEAILARGDSRLYVLTMAAKRHRAGVAVACTTLLGLVGVLAVLAMSNTRLRSALDESLLRQLHAHISAGEREKAEAILWPQLDGLMLSHGDVSTGLWAGTLKQRRMLWAFMEMQAKGLCLSADSLGMGRAVTLSLLDDGTFSVMRTDRRMIRLTLDGGTISASPGPALSPDTFMAWYTPSGSCVFAIVPGAMLLLDAKSGQTIASEPFDRQMSEIVATIVGEKTALMAFHDGRCVAYEIPTFRVRFEQSGLSRSHRPSYDVKSETLSYLDERGMLHRVRVDDGTELRSDYQRGFGTELAGPSYVIISSDNKLAAMTYGSELRVESLGDNGPQAVRLLKPGYRVSISFDPTGRYLAATAYGTSSLRLWNTLSWQEINPLSIGRNTVDPVFAADGSRILTVDNTGMLRVWSLDGYGWKARLSEPTSRSHRIALDGEWVYLISDAGEVIAASPESGSGPLDGSVGAAHPDATHVDVTRDGSRLAMAGLGGVVRVCWLDGSRPPEDFHTSGSVRATGLGFDPSGQRLAVCTDREELLVIGLGAGEDAERVLLPGGASASDLAWTGDGGLVVVTLRDGRVAVRSAEIGSVPRVHRVSSQQLRAVEPLGEGGSVLAIGDSGSVYELDARTGNVRASERISEHSLFALAVHPAGGTIAVGDRSGRITIVDRETFAALGAFEAGGAVMSLVFSTDGQSLIVSSLDRPVERWDLATLARTYRAIRQDGPQHSR